MARKSDKDEALGIVIFFMIVLVVIGYFLIKWFIIGLIILISAISVLVINLHKKSNIKRAIKDIENSIFTENEIRPTKNVNRKQLKEKLGIFDIDIYNDLFESKIRLRGQAYYANKKVQNIKKSNNNFTATIKGNAKYNVLIQFDNDNIKYANCTCPYYQEDKKNCKHIYALLLKVKSEKNIPIILETITDFSKRLTKMIVEETQYIINNQKALKLKRNEIDSCNNNIDIYKNELKLAINNIEKYKYNETILMDTLIDLIESSYSFNEKIKSIISNSGKVENPVSISKVYETIQKDDKIRLRDVAAGYLVADELSKMKNKKDKNYNENLEKEMDAYNLEDWQKDLVRKRRIQCLEF